MKILFVPGEYPFCYYYRGYLPGVYAGQMVVSDYLRKDAKFSGEKMLAQAMDADVLVFQRPSSKTSLELAKLLKQKGKKIIFENDDTYTGIPLQRLGNEKQVAIAKELSKNINDFLKIADGAIASTEVLGKEYGALNSNVAVLKNCIDPLDALPCKKNTTGKFRIGLMGSVTTNDDYNHIKDDLRKLDERGDITIVILGVKFPDGTIMPSMQEDYEFWKSLKNVEWHNVVHVTEVMSKMASMALDLAIIPRKEHYFNQCKSNLKFLEMSLLEIPVLAQGFSDGTSPYQGRDEPYMTVIRDRWYENIISIKDNYEEAKAKAKEAKRYVLENYNIKTYAKEWVETIKKLIK
jgi:glycosyltransferase involved in cell wall biosynthesis